LEEVEKIVDGELEMIKGKLKIFQIEFVPIGKKKGVINSKPATNSDWLHPIHLKLPIEG